MKTIIRNFISMFPLFPGYSKTLKITVSSQIQLSEKRINVIRILSFPKASGTGTTNIMYGDLNKNKKIDIGDLLKLKRHSR